VEIMARDDFPSCVQADHVLFLSGAYHLGTKTRLSFVKQNTKHILLCE
jgi:hypothetical protein